MFDPTSSQPVDSPADTPAVDSPAVAPAVDSPAVASPAAPDPVPASPQAETAVSASESDAGSPSPAPKLGVGDIVRHAWTDPTGDHEAYGLVVELDDENDRASVAWLAGRSGLIPLDDLEVLGQD